MPRDRQDEARRAELGRRAANSEQVENAKWKGKSKIQRDARNAQRIAAIKKGRR